MTMLTIRTPRTIPLALVALALVGGTLRSAGRSAAAAEPPALPADHAERMAKGLVMFQEHVSTLLKERCLACHGGEKTRGEFDLATREGLLQGGGSGPAVVPFQAQESLLYQLITHSEEPAMPDEQPKLSDEAIARLAAWIDHGAPYDVPLVAGKKPPRDPRVVSEEDRQWWAFQPLAQVSPPAVQNQAAVRNDVDRFLLAKAEARGLSLAPAAEKRNLIRRAYLDLLGLPPPPEEVAAFLQDESPDAWPRLVDRLLDSPHFGERWARHWLDVARFAESAGFEHDYDRPGAWAYRDFVIKALNADLPFDQFVHWQLAGDEFEPDNPLALSATGFLGAGVFPTQITANEVERTRYDALDDMLSTTGSAFLGLTIGCARCHDHKYDPIPTYDYYRLLSTFTTTVRSNLEVELEPEKSAELRRQWEAEHQPLVAELAQYEESLQPKFSAWLSAGGEASSAVTWTVLDLAEIKSQAGARFRRLDDGSYLAEGPNGEQDEYTLTATTSLRKLTGLRLEALAHPSLVKGGPGRAGNGNFALSRLTVSAAPKSGGTAVPVKLAKAEVTFEQNQSGLSIASTLDDNPSTGWAVDPQFGKDHAAVYTFAEPLDYPDGTQLSVQLEFRVNALHNIGRPRLSVISEVAPSLQAQTLPAAVSRTPPAGQDARRSGPADGRPAPDAVRLVEATRSRLAVAAGEDRRAPRPSAEEPDDDPPLRRRLPADAAPHAGGRLLQRDLLPRTRQHRSQAGSRHAELPAGPDAVARRRAAVAVAAAGRREILRPPPLPGRLAHRRRPRRRSVDGPRDRESPLAAPFRHGPGRHTQRLRAHGHAAVASGTAGLAGGRAASQRLEAQAAAQAAHDQRRLRAEFRPGPREGSRRPRQRVVRAPAAAAAGGRSHPGQHPGRLGTARPNHVRPRHQGRAEPAPQHLLHHQAKPADRFDGGLRPARTAGQPGQPPRNHRRPAGAVADERAAGARRGRRVCEASRSGSAGRGRFRPAVTRAYWLAISRPPVAEELQDAVAFLDQQAGSYAAESRPQPRSLALADLCQVLFGLNEFAYEE